jgi:rRNA biogenesis protein RRP5
MQISKGSFSVLQIPVTSGFNIMSFQLPLSEVDKAREIARRAIKTINFREEQERLNVWIALAELWRMCTAPSGTLEAVFKEAARANDSKTVHLRLASIFEQSDKAEVF